MQDLMKTDLHTAWLRLLKSALTITVMFRQSALQKVRFPMCLKEQASLPHITRLLSRRFQLRFRIISPLRFTRAKSFQLRLTAKPTLFMFRTAMFAMSSISLATSFPMTIFSALTRTATLMTQTASQSSVWPIGTKPKLSRLILKPLRKIQKMLTLEKQRFRLRANRAKLL